MSETNLGAQNSLPINSQPPEVAHKVGILKRQGALDVDSLFNVADHDQADLVLDDHRYLVTAHDEHYDRYKRIMENAGLPYIENDKKLGDDRVVVGEIDLDARSLPLIIPSVQPKEGVNTQDAFRLAGQAIERIIATNGVAPTAQSLKLNKLLLLRGDDVRHTLSGVMLVPDIDFEPAAPDAKQQLAERISQELQGRYQKFGGQALAAAFKEGLGNGGDN